MKKGTTKADGALPDSPAAKYLATYAHTPSPKSVKALADAAGIHNQRAYEWNARLAPVIETWRDLQLESIMPLWKEAAVTALWDARADATPRERRDLMIAGGVAMDKWLLLEGRPTQITAHLEEVRVTLPQLLRRIDVIDVTPESPT